MAKKKKKGGEQKRANRIQNKITVKQTEHLCAYELNLTLATGETDQREEGSGGKLTSSGMCASLMNNGSGPVNDCLPDPQKQLQRQGDCSAHFDDRTRTTGLMFPSFLLICCC